MMLMNKDKKILKKTIKTALLWLIKPFIIPILLLAFIFSIISSITDILYVAFNHEDEIDLAKEIKYYYTDGEYDKEEMKGFFSSVWDWVNDLMGGKEIAEDIEWPVVRILYNYELFWTKNITNKWSIYIS